MLTHMYILLHTLHLRGFERFCDFIIEKTLEKMFSFFYKDIKAPDKYMNPMNISTIYNIDLKISTGSFSKKIRIS